MEVVRFEQKYYDDLLSFSQKVWPQKSEDYLKFRLYQFPEHNDDASKNLLLINIDGKIVGCMLYIPTKARINGLEKEILWGHDLFVEEQYRGAGSLLLMIEMSKTSAAYGIGSTDINFKILKESKSNFIGVDYHYLIFNIWSFKLLFVKLKLLRFPDTKEFGFPAILNIGSNRFIKVLSEKELNIPDSGYWSDPNLIEIDLVRDKHFLKNRFFENFIKYHFYKLKGTDADKSDECYFVVRPTFEGGFPVLSIVDFRFNMKKHEQFQALLKAGNRLGKINRLPLVSFRTTMKLSKVSLFPFFYRTNSKQHIIAPSNISKEFRILITNADSDTDFISL